MRLSAALFAGMLTLGCISPAAAVTINGTLNPPTFSDSFVGYTAGGFVSEGVSATGAYTESGMGATGTLTVGFTPSPFITGSVSTTVTSQLLGAVAEATLDYQVEIVGPNGPVTVSVTASGSTSGSGEGVGVAGFVTYDDNNNQISASAQTGFNSSAPASFSVTQTFPQMANTPFSMEIFARGQVELGNVSSQGYGSIDPYFFIPISDPNASSYTILTSPGIGNSPTVPELSTWVMMMLGFAGLGFAGYRGSRKSAIRP